MQSYADIFSSILDDSVYQIRRIEPADWAEQNVKITTGRYTGPLKYDLSPHCRDIINALSPSDPCNEVVVMGAAKWGKTKTIIEPAIAYWISEHPCEMMYLTGHSDLADESMDKLGSALDNSGLRHLIRHQSLAVGNRKTGDTTKIKHFPGGFLVSGSATNHKLLRQRDPRFVLADDIEASKGASKESGATVGLIRKRTNSWGDLKKIAWISTPELAEGSIIESLYLEGDQQKRYVPCQCCGELIVLEWETEVDGCKAGFHWQVDKSGLLVPGSVEYVCQSCGGAFDESNKYEFNLCGQWKPTCENPINKKMKSFHLAGWYQPPGMDTWEMMVHEYLMANPVGLPQNKHDHKVWITLTAGQTYREEFQELDSRKLQANIQDYEVCNVPEKLSIQQGNGKFVLITCAGDCNGLIDNGRLDYEVVGWTESGTSYSLDHGSIGTFVPAVMRRKGHELRDEIPWTYEENKPNYIFAEFKKIATRQYPVDTDGRRMATAITLVDVGNTYKDTVYKFIQQCQAEGLIIQGIKGKENKEYLYNEKDTTIINHGKEVKNVFWTLEVGFMKDRLAARMELNWGRNEEHQPGGFMNFPHPGNGKYEAETFFAHYESEQKVLVSNKTETAVKACWKKKQTNLQNHFFDCHVYNMAAKDIWIILLNERRKLEKMLWDWNKWVIYCTQ